MRISHLSDAVRYTGRWAKNTAAAVTTACGASLELAFTGKDCVLFFDVKSNAAPFPHVYLQLDGGAKVDVAIDHYVRVEASDEGNHVLKVILKCSVENYQRWYEPLTSKISFIGAEAEGEGVLLEDNREIIEFIGDSITEGTWVDEQRMTDGNRENYKNMVFQNDSTATYAYLTAEALGMRPWIMGYGSVGLTKSGGGGVPRVHDAYPYAFHNTSREIPQAKIIVMNHGANDFAASEQEYIDAYQEFIKLVRKINPNAQIVALSAFLGRYPDAVGKMVERYNAETGDSVLFINTSGWIPREPVHPAREGHKVVAEKLVGILRERLDL